MCGAVWSCSISIWDMTKNFPEWFNEYFMNIFARGIFSTATFMVVMFLGTITKHNKLSRKLMSVRGENINHW